MCCFNIMRIQGLALGWLVLALPGFPAFAAEKAATQLPASLLGFAYVDMRNGFSVRAPLDYSLGSFAREGFPDLVAWDQLKVPSSKELVSFRGADGQTGLAVYLLATRKKMTVDDLLGARAGYWQTFPDQATLGETGTETVSGLPAVVTQLVWKGNKASKPVRVRETLVQRKANRYFMVVQVGAEADGQEVMDAAIAGAFVCMDEAEIKLRWTAARKSAKELLAPLDSAGLKSVFTGERYYRLLRSGKDVGFHCERRSVEVLADQKQHYLQVDAFAFAANNEVAQAYAELVGWRTCAGESTFSGGVRLESHFRLDGELKTEGFEYRAQGTGADERAVEKGEWKEKSIAVHPCQGGGQEVEGDGVEALVVTARVAPIYLPLSLVDVLGQFVKREDGAEYLFARYFYRTLGFYALRVVGQVDLALEKKEGEDEEQVIKAWYMVRQLNSQGPIVETWVDDQGEIVLRKADGLEVVQASREEIAGRWGKELARVLPEKKQKNVTGND